MVYGVVLAGGIGSRMGNVEKPKQFLHIGKKPIIVHTVEKFCVNSQIEKVIVLCPEQWVSYTKDLLKKYLGTMENVSIIPGGKSRNDTIMNAIDFIEKNYGLDEDSIVITHDAVRPFVTHRIIEDNIKAVEEGAACDTVIPATDTIVESMDNHVISQIPDRSKYYQCHRKFFSQNLFRSSSLIISLIGIANRQMCWSYQYLFSVYINICKMCFKPSWRRQTINCI